MAATHWVLVLALGFREGAPSTALCGCLRPSPGLCFPPSVLSVCPFCLGQTYPPLPPPPPPPRVKKKTPPAHPPTPAPNTHPPTHNRVVRPTSPRSQRETGRGIAQWLSARQLGGPEIRPFHRTWRLHAETPPGRRLCDEGHKEPCAASERPSGCVHDVQSSRWSDSFTDEHGYMLTCEATRPWPRRHQS